jgi:single stranded DNA-binding protein (ssb)
MPTFNRVVLAGHLTREVDLRKTKNGSSVANAGIAVNDRVKRGDEYVDEPTFLDLTLFGKTADFAAEYCGRGSLVLVEGRLKQDKWQDTDGKEKSKIVVIVEQLKLFERSKKQQDEKPASNGDPF